MSEKRMNAGVKLLLLSVALTLVMLTPSLDWLGFAGAIVATVTVFSVATGRASFAELLTSIRPITLMLVVTALINLLFLGWQSSILLTGRIWLAVILATLFTLTTRTIELLDTLVGWLKPLIGEPRADQVGLAVALTIRSIPRLNDIVREVSEARKARGLERSPRALLIPAIVRTVITANELGDALHARGFSDGNSDSTRQTPLVH